MSADLESVKIVQEALLKAKGKLFPISSVVHCGTPFFSNLASFGIVQDKIHEEQHRDGDKSAFLLPFTTTFDEFLFRQKEKTGAGKKTKYSATLKISKLLLDLIITLLTCSHYLVMKINNFSYFSIETYVVTPC